MMTDVALAPGVLDFLDRLVREQLAPELYGFVQRLKRKAGSWCPTRSDSSACCTTADIVAYLDERSSLRADGGLEGDTAAPAPPPAPLLPPHPAEWSPAALTPISDFVKAICEVFSLDACITRQVGTALLHLRRCWSYCFLPKSIKISSNAEGSQIWLAMEGGSFVLD